MRGLSLLALILLLSINADGVTGAICTPTGGILVVSSGQSCDLTTSLTGLTEAQIYGTVYVFGTPGNVAPVLEAHNIYVYSTGTIVADGNGYDAMNGPGKGSTTGSGGSHGGRGGMKTGVYLKSDEAITYGSIEKPSYYGSGGGCSTGGKGGGVITLQADSSIQIDGLVSANGNNDGGSCGGGSGGSIYINTDYFKGSGMITARGGAGSGTGGGGGGGRISIVHKVSKTFTGNIFADGGDISGDIVLLPIASMNAYDYNTDTSYYGDMTKHATVSWRANTMSTVQWLEATLSPAKWITRIATRGHPNANYYVTKYKIQYYNDTSLLWVPLSFPSDGYSGNTDKSGVVTNNLFAPIYTTKIRFYPQTWYRGIGMAVSLYGYSNYDLASVPPTTCSSITTGMVQ